MGPVVATGWQLYTRGAPVRMGPAAFHSHERRLRLPGARQPVAVSHHTVPPVRATAVLCAGELQVKRGPICSEGKQ